MAPAALDLLGKVGAAVALDLESEIVISDPLLSDTDLVDAVLTELGEGVSAHVLVAGDSPRARSARRLHWAQGRSVLGEVSGDVSPLVVTRLPGPDGATDTAGILTAADDVQLEITKEQRAVLIGPATALCDRVDEDLEQRRDHFIRLGRLRCAVRLPAGLVTDGSRHALGLWVLGAERESRRIQEQSLATADLTNATLSTDVVDDIVTDAVASLTDRDRGTHAFRHARLMLTAKLLADSGPLVTPGSKPARSVGTASAEEVIRLRQLAAELDRRRTSSPVLGDLQVTPAEAAAPVGEVTVAEAMDAKHVRVLSGTRMREDVPTATTGVRVIDADTVRDPAALRRGIDAVDLEAAWPRSRRTEPGDVIFCTSPRPAAIIDHDGMSVVAYPARILRCQPDSGLVPEVVARAINDLPARSPRWRAWSLPRVPAGQEVAVGTALRHLAEQQDRARQRLTDLDTLATQLARGIAAGAMTLTDHPQEGH